MSGGVFRSLANPEYRAWAAAALVSNIGTWMQRTAQDWLVLTALTRHDAAAVGVVMALQFGPQILLLTLTGYAADHFDRRRLLIATQTTMAALALLLGVLTVTGAVRLEYVYVFAFLLGCATAFDAPARQAFVSDLVSEADLGNAVGLNSTSFNGARMIGPAVAGLLISWIGTGWVFILNALSFIAVIAVLHRLRPTGSSLSRRIHATRGGMGEGFRYVWGRADLKALLLMLFLIGTFGLNFPIFISTMAVGAFHAGADRFGLLSSMMAIGSVSGALLAARREKQDVPLLVIASAAFGAGCAIAALMPGYGWFGAVLVLVGLAAQTVTTSTNSLVQLSTAPAMRGRVIAILLAVTLGGTPIGAPIVGWVANQFGPRWGLGVGAASGIAAAAVGLVYLMRHRRVGPT